MKLPEPTQDLQQAKLDLDSHGLCCMAGVLNSAELARAHAAIYRAAADDLADGRHATEFALDTNEHNQRVWNLLTRDAVFATMVEHPSALALVRHLIGWPALLSNISGNIAGPGTSIGVLHADQIFVPEPWPEQPQGINVAWCLDDFTAANGGTRVAPGSHRLSHLPSTDDDLELVPLEAPAGTMFAFDSRVWHQTGLNTTGDQTRAGVFAFYTTPIYRTQENWFLTLDEEFLNTASDELLTLLAYKSTGFGLAYGRSPR
jgi:ectoine hydroxylase-related dioxygenase (phytanoyl-CoA dioxygenase family)